MKQELVVKTAAKMQETILMDSEKLLRKVSQVTQKRINLFPDSDTFTFLWPLKSHNAFAFYFGNPIMLLIIQ